jgi:hypothetical protein
MNRKNTIKKALPILDGLFRFSRISNSLSLNNPPLPLFQENNHYKIYGNE